MAYQHLSSRRRLLVWGLAVLAPSQLLLALLVDDAWQRVVIGLSAVPSAAIVVLMVSGRSGPVFLRIVMVDRREGRRHVNWSSVALVAVLLMSAVAIGAGGLALAIGATEPGAAFVVGAATGLLGTLLGLVDGLLTPIDELTSLAQKPGCPHVETSPPG